MSCIVSEACEPPSTTWEKCSLARRKYPVTHNHSYKTTKSKSKKLLINTIIKSCMVCTSYRALVIIEASSRLKNVGILPVIIDTTIGPVSELRGSTKLSRGNDDRDRCFFFYFGSKVAMPSFPSKVVSTISRAFHACSGTNNSGA